MSWRHHDKLFSWHQSHYQCVVCIMNKIQYQTHKQHEVNTYCVVMMLILFLLRPCFLFLFYYLILYHIGAETKMAAILQTLFSNAFSWMKMFEFWLKLDWSLFPRVQLQYSSIGLDNGLAPSVSACCHMWYHCFCSFKIYNSLATIHQYRLSSSCTILSVLSENFISLSHQRALEWCKILIDIELDINSNKNSHFFRKKSYPGYLMAPCFIQVQSLTVPTLAQCLTRRSVCCWVYLHSKFPMFHFNSLLPNDAIWWHRSRSTLAQVMACWLMAPSHYLNQSWLIFI